MMKNQSISAALAEAIEAASPATVRIEGRRRLPATGLVYGEDLVVTAHHVVKQDENIVVGLADGQAVKANLVGRDPTTDLAVLRLDGAALTPASIADAGTLKVGHLVLALGRPGQNVQATIGIISALDGNWRTAAGGQIDRYLQTDVLMYPGFSGGPLLNEAGEILGINSSALRRGTSLTIPMTTVTATVTTLLTHGRIRRGYLGISTQPVRLPENIKAAVGQRSGLLLTGVESDSPAEKGGLLLGDTIIALAGGQVRHHDDLMALLMPDRVDTAVPVTIVRGGQVQDVTVTVGER
jgi:S1-C subfamily serine protease